MDFSKEFIDKIIDSIRLIDLSEVDRTIEILYELRQRNGRLFIIGSGGGAGHASHAACDFIKLCSIQAYSLDNISLLTAITNDHGFEHTTTHWLKSFNFNSNDCIMVISVGGGKDGVSMNIVNALELAKLTGAKIIGIVGRDGGRTKELADATILIQAKDHVTPITEAIQAMIWHLFVTDPRLAVNKTKW